MGKVGNSFEFTVDELNYVLSLLVVCCKSTHRIWGRAFDDMIGILFMGFFIHENLKKYCWLMVVTHLIPRTCCYEISFRFYNHKDSNTSHKFVNFPSDDSRIIIQKQNKCCFLIQSRSEISLNGAILTWYVTVVVDWIGLTQ